MSNVDPTTDEGNEPEGIKNLRRQAAEGSDAKAENARLQREMAFMRAGVDTTSKPAQAMIAGFSGELNNEAILAEAQEWGLVKPPAAPTADPGSDPTSPEAQQQAIRDQQSGQPAPVLQPPAKLALDQTFENYHTNRKQGMSQDAAEVQAFGEVIRGAAQGDKSVIFDPRAWAAEQEQAGHGRPR